MSPFLVPTTTSPWIWPSNGKIIRGPLPKFLIPTIFGGFQRCIYDYFSYIHRFSFVSLMMIWSFITALVQLTDGEYFLFLICWTFDIIVDYIPLSWDASLWFSNLWFIWFYHLLLGSLLVGPPFKDPSTLSKVGCFRPLWLVCFHEYCFPWFLSCHSLSSDEVSIVYLMFWMGFGGCDSSTTLFPSPWHFLLKTSWIDMILEVYPPLVSQESMFKVSTQPNEEIQIYWPPSVGPKCGH